MCLFVSLQSKLEKLWTDFDELSGNVDIRTKNNGLDVCFDPDHCLNPRIFKLINNIACVGSWQSFALTECSCIWSFIDRVVTWGLK